MLVRKISKDYFKTYCKIREIIIKADVPASSRKVDINIGRYPSSSMDTIVLDFIRFLHRHWWNIFFVSMITWVDLNDEGSFCKSTMKGLRVQNDDNQGQKTKTYL